MTWIRFMARPYSVLSNGIIGTNSSVQSRSQRTNCRREEFWKFSVLRVKGKGERIEEAGMDRVFLMGTTLSWHIFATACKGKLECIVVAGPI